MNEGGLSIENTKMKKTEGLEQVQTNLKYEAIHNDDIIIKDPSISGHDSIPSGIQLDLNFMDSKST